MRGHLDGTLLHSIRMCVAANFGLPVQRLGDKVVLEQFNQILKIGHYFRTLPDVEMAIHYMIASSVTPADLQSYFDRAIGFLDFTVAPNAGILYSGQYQLDDDLSRRSSRPSSAQLSSSPSTIIDMESLAKLHASIAKKTLIDFTPGGKWLFRWNLPFLVGEDRKDAIWSKASIKYVTALSGHVDVFLAYPLPERVFRSVEGRALLNNPAVTKVTYFLEHPVGENAAGKEFHSKINPDFHKTRFGKELVFRTAIPPTPAKP